MTKSKIIEVSQIMVHSLQPYNYKYTKFQVLYESGQKRTYKHFCKTVSRFIGAKHHEHYSELINPRENLIEFRYTYV